jgi:hypothetical protein
MQFGGFEEKALLIFLVDPGKLFQQFVSSVTLKPVCFDMIVALSIQVFEGISGSK